jgi:hypothetical protein
LLQHVERKDDVEAAMRERHRRAVAADEDAAGVVTRDQIEVDDVVSGREALQVAMHVAADFQDAQWCGTTSELCHCSRSQRVTLIAIERQARGRFRRYLRVHSLTSQRWSMCTRPSAK